MKKAKKITAAIIAASLILSGAMPVYCNAITANTEKLDWVTLKSKSDSEILELYKAYCEDANMNFPLYTTDEGGNKIFNSAYYRWQARAAYDTAPESATYIIDLGKEFDVNGYFNTTGLESYGTDTLDPALFGFTGENNISCFVDFNIGGALLIKFRDKDCKKTSIYEEMRRQMAIYYSDFMTEYRGEQLYIEEDLPTRSPSYIKGDANVDARINVADAVAVLQYIANNIKYPLGDIGIMLADIDGEEGITGSDVAAIQNIDAMTWDEDI